MPMICSWICHGVSLWLHVITFTKYDKFHSFHMPKRSHTCASRVMIKVIFWNLLCNIRRHKPRLVSLPPSFQNFCFRDNFRRVKDTILGSWSLARLALWAACAHTRSHDSNLTILFLVLVCGPSFNQTDQVSYQIIDKFLLWTMSVCDFEITFWLLEVWNWARKLIMTKNIARFKSAVNMCCACEWGILGDDHNVKMWNSPMNSNSPIHPASAIALRACPFIPNTLLWQVWLGIVIIVSNVILFHPRVKRWNFVWLFISINPFLDWWILQNVCFFFLNLSVWWLMWSIQPRPWSTMTMSLLSFLHGFLWSLQIHF